MRITAIHIDGFGKLRDLDLKLEEGLNLIAGANEAGKSTIHIFIKSMLYGADTARKAGRRPDYERMRPWGFPSVYGGSMDVYKSGRLYRISRNFDAAADDITVSSLDDGGENIQDTGQFMKELLKGLSESAYMSTVSPAQLGTETDRGLAGEIVRYASNISTSVNPELDAGKALSFLDNKKRSLNDRLVPDAAKEYNRLLSRASALEASIMEPGRSNRINEYREADAQAERMAGETAMDLAQNELIISEREERLREHGLAGTRDVEELRDSAEELKNTCDRKKKAFPIYLILGIAGCLAGAAGLICVLMNIPGIAERLALYQAYILVGATALTIFGVLMLVLAVLTARTRSRAYSELYGLIEEHIGEGTGNLDSDMELFDEQIWIYLRDAGTVGAAMEERMRLRDKLKGFNTDRGRYGAELRRQQEIKSGIEKDLEELKSISRRMAELERAIEDNKSIRDSIDAVELAQETITRLASGIKGSAGTYINAEAGRMLEGVTGGAYNSLDMGSGRNIRINSRRGLIPIEDMSRGTADQIFLAVRIAAARFLTGEGDEIPLIMDESFVLYDDARLLNSLTFLTENFKGQMIVFTCRLREESLLGRAGIRYNLIRI